ncbi:MAG TPA: histidinol-phosphatase [Geminicoccaceae bacterium]|nr:histidinol-phosphatase [Geminicoccaceae bacterium]
MAAEYLAFAHELADRAGEVLRRYYRAPVAVDYKMDASPVTTADREAERVMRDLIRTRFPEHGIEGEEFASEHADAELVWNLDPIDGTKAFMIGKPTFGTLISLLRDDRPVLGIIDQCISHERWVGILGEPSTLNGAPIRVRPCADLEHAVLSTTSPQMFKAAEEQAAFARVASAVRFPVYGGDCYGYGLLAMGFADLVVEADLDLHDFAALVPVIEGAGGVITDWQGRPLRPGSDGRVVAAGDPRAHAQALALLAQGS